MRKALALAVIGEPGAPAEPFRAWIPSSGGTPAPRPVTAVRAEDAVQAREAILAGTAAGRAGEQEKNAHNSFSQTQRHPDTAGNPFTANDAVPEQAEIPFPEPTGHQNKRKFPHGIWQDAKTQRNCFPKTGRTPKYAGTAPPRKKGLAHKRVTMIQLQWHSTVMMSRQDRTRRRGAWSGEAETSSRQTDKKANRIAEKIIDRLDELSETRPV